MPFALFLPVKLVQDRTGAERIAGVPQEDFLEDAARVVVAGQVGEAAGQAHGGFDQRPVRRLLVRQRSAKTRSQGSASDRVRIAIMAPGQIDASLVPRQPAEQHVCFQKVRTALQQPTQLVAGHVGFSGGEHLVHLGHVVGALAGARRMNQLKSVRSERS